MINSSIIPTKGKILNITGKPNYIEIVALNDFKNDIHEIMASRKIPKSKIKKRFGAVGGILENIPLICGGIYENSQEDVCQDGFILGQPDKKIEMLKKRAHASCVVLDSNIKYSIIFLLGFF